MKKPANSSFQAARPKPMSQRSFKCISEFIYNEVGIKLPPVKITMLEARLQKRLRMFGFSSYDDYCEFVFSPHGQNEIPELIDVVTTNTTEFFREPAHFKTLTDTILPAWMRRRGGKKLKVWSAGCSIGMEPYTLAMVLNEFMEKHSDFSFSLMATDISMEALQTAYRGIYNEDQVDVVPIAMKRKYMMRSKDKKSKRVRMAPEVRKQINFKRLNFKAPFTDINPVNIIFCRNVIIYFDRPTQEVLFQKFCQVLARDGYLFIGHSESLTGMNLPLAQIAPTIYQRL